MVIGFIYVWWIDILRHMPYILQHGQDMAEIAMYGQRETNMNKIIATPAERTADNVDQWDALFASYPASPSPKIIKTIETTDMHHMGIDYQIEEISFGDGRGFSISSDAFSSNFVLDTFKIAQDTAEWRIEGNGY